MSACADCRQPTSCACPWCHQPVCGDCFDAGRSAHRLGHCTDIEDT